MSCHSATDYFPPDDDIGRWLYSKAAIGEQMDFGRHIPLAWRMVADPHGTHKPPIEGTMDSDDFDPIGHRWFTCATTGWGGRNQPWDCPGGSRPDSPLIIRSLPRSRGGGVPDDRVRGVGVST